ncbi:S16 family serine protease [Methanoculleus sp.]|uniref:S16 family serine protease n=1 Tax=Methanoculleus sp. TaxID=90427 RepID=UPI0025DC2167|nr:S16 family serine protease [Methanoculleus sp.]
MRIRGKTLTILLLLSLFANVFFLAAVLMPGEDPSPALSKPEETSPLPTATISAPVPEKAAEVGTASMQAPVILQRVEVERGRGPFVYEEVAEEGTMVTVSVEVVPGRGRVLVQTTPLMGTVFQETANRAVVFAANDSRVDLTESDIIFSIQGPEEVSEIDGPSAGALMVTLLLSVLEEFELNESVTVTGTIGEDGSIGPVSGVLEKAEAAAASGKTLLVLPEGNDRVVTYGEDVRSIGGLRIARQQPEIVDAKEYIEEHLGIRVEYADSIDDLLVDVRAPATVPTATPL